MADQITFTVGGESGVRITVREENGALVFVVTTSSENSSVADLRGLFFQVADESILPLLEVLPGEGATDYEINANKVVDLGQGANMQGTGLRFDIGVEFGTAGAGQDDIRTGSFTLRRADGEPLDLSLIAQETFGARVISKGASKLVDAAPDALNTAADSFVTTEDGEPVAAFNVLDNDYAGLGGTLTVTDFDIEILSSDLAGASVLDLSGIGTDGSLVFTPTDAYDALASGETVVFRYTYSVSNGIGGTGTNTGTLTIVGVNDGPEIGTNTGATVRLGNSVTISREMLEEADPDDSGAGLTYTVTDLPDYGALLLNGSELGLHGTFTQADIDAGRLTYSHVGLDLTPDSFAFSLADGGEDGAEAVEGVFDITVRPEAGFNGKLVQYSYLFDNGGGKNELRKEVVEVGSGVEIKGFYSPTDGQGTVDIGNTSIIIDFYASPIFQGFFSGFQISDISGALPEILGVTVNEMLSKNLEGSAPLISYGEDVIEVNFAPMSYGPCTKVVLDVVFA